MVLAGLLVQLDEGRFMDSVPGSFSALHLGGDGVGFQELQSVISRQ